jgi:hypothetical protein
MKSVKSKDEVQYSQFSIGACKRWGAARNGTPTSTALPEPSPEESAYRDVALCGLAGGGAPQNDPSSPEG